MKVQSTYQGGTYKEVTIEHDFEDRPVSDDLVVGFAMANVGETPERLFGWEVRRPVEFHHLAVVTLHTS